MRRKVPSFALLLSLLAVVSSNCSCSRPAPSPPTTGAAPSGPLRVFGGKIVFEEPPGSTLDVKAARDDLAATLHLMTGETFVVSSQDGAPTEQAIEVRLASSPGAPADDAARLASRGPESFVVHSRDGKAWIVGKSPQALVWGVYRFLQDLGCRWLAPGDAWTVIPRRNDIETPLDEVVEPAFRMRTFSGTGGFGPATPAGQPQAIAALWADWQRRNGLGGEFLMSGHMGEAFNVAHRTELEAHPEWRPLINGQRQPWSDGMKWCLADEKFVQTFIADRLAAARAEIKDRPNDPHAFAVSAEPADGAGNWCDCDKCHHIGNGSVSDRVFWLASAVARALRAELPNMHVTVLGYNDHVDVPTVPLDPNIYVFVIPEAFQRTGKTADELLDAWMAKIHKGGLYTYWSIPDWTYDAPTFDFTKTPAERISYWHNHGVDGVQVESTYSIGAMGLAWYLASRLLWDPSADTTAIASEFYALGFETAAPPMKRMLERWANGFLATSEELGQSLADLAEARRDAAGNAPVLYRIGMFERYLEYLRLYYELQRAPAASAQRLAAARSLVTWLWRIEGTTMVTSYRLEQLVVTRLAKDPTLQSDFALNNPSAPGWRTVTPVGDDEVARLMSDGQSHYRPANLDTRTFGTNLVPATNVVASASSQPAYSPAFLLGGTTSFEFESPQGGAVDFLIQVHKDTSKDAPSDRVTILDAKRGTVLDQTLPPDGVARTIHITATPGARYTARIIDQKTQFTLQVPLGLPHSFSGFAITDLSPEVYFFVPHGVQRFGLFSPSVVPISLFDGDHRPVQYQGDDLLVLTVPPGQDGRIWSLKGYKSWTPLQTRGIPQNFSLTPSLLVPDDALH